MTAEPPKEPPDDSYPTAWLPTGAAAAVRQMRTAELTASLSQLSHEELLSVLTDALERKA